MSSEIELGLHRASVEVLIKLNRKDPRRQEVERLAHLAIASENGRVEVTNLPTPEELITQKKEAWKQFLGKEIDVPQPPQQLLEVASRAQEHGITSFEAHFLPKMEFKQNSRFPLWQIRPEDRCFQMIKEGRVAKDTAKLPGVWVLIDSTQKPNYDYGKQLYQNDGFGTILADLREEGIIAVPESYKHVPNTSRFAVTPDEREAHFNTRLAQILAINPSQVRIVREIEFNVIGNIHHPEWGQTNTLEWFDDSFGGDGRLYGGCSGLGGLAHVSCYWSDGRYDIIGFRPLVEFSSKS